MHNKLVIFDWNGIIESRISNECDFNKCFFNVIKHFNGKVDSKNILVEEKKLFLELFTITDKSLLEEWINKLSNKYNFNCSVEDFIRIYVREFSKIDYYKRVVDFIHSLKGIVNIAIFSDLSILDKNRLDMEVNLDMFDYKFLSFETNLLKNNALAYKYVEVVSNIQGDNILYIDFDMNNINMAKEMGWNICNCLGHEITKIISCINDFLDIKPEIFKVEKLDHFGRGIIHINGKTAFIDDALVNEEIQIEITKENKNYLEGVKIASYKDSIDRIKPKCSKFYECGGCNLQHLLFIKENEFKKNKVIELIERFTDIDSSVVGDIAYTNDYFYRNKVTLHGKDGKLGYHKNKSNDLIVVDECKLVSDKINKIIKLFSNIEHDICELTIRVDNDDKYVMVKVKGEFDNYKDILDDVDVLIINDKVITNNDMIISNIGDKKFYLSIDSFFQVNMGLTCKLYDEVRDIVMKSKAKKILDLYCGTGTIGIYVSSYVNEVIGIDYSKSGISNANNNKKLNEVNNIKFICNKVENVIDSFTNDIDLIIVDPPRSGLDKKTIKNIIRINPAEIIYVSCDPATLSRDLNLLSDNYEVKFIKPYNMFPRTYHVENVCYLKKK